MEVDAIIELFKRSVETFGVMYRNYIGDGDSKTYSGILKAAPYSDQEVIKKNVLDMYRREWARDCEIV